MKKFLALIILFVGLYFAGRIGLVWNKANSDSSDRVSFTIERGMTLEQISNLLEEKKLVRDAWVFRVFAKWNKLSNKLQAGEFVLQKNLTFNEVAEVLQTGKAKEVRVTIPEGSTIAQIDEILAKKSLIHPEEFVKCTNFCDLGFRISSLEGYLFPSTYFVNPQSFSSAQFISRLYNTFQQQIAPLRIDLGESGHTLDEVVRMASMIEREANNEEEMPIISGVLWKRIRDGIHLGVDATTRYELNEWKRPLYTADFQRESPYNTRKNYGLPPTAISNPGLPAISAAISPVKTEYYYYLHDLKGQVHFAKDHDGHVKNKQMYLQ